MKNATFVSVLLTLLIASLFFAVSAGPALTSQGSQIQANSFTASQGIQPYMTMNTNITWSTFYNGWSPLEYNTSTRNNTLNTQLNSNYANPITVNPADIVAPGVLQNEKVGGQYWNNTQYWNLPSTNGGSVLTKNIGTYNGESTIIFAANTSKTSSNALPMNTQIPIADLPSSNPNYDYITIIYGVSGTPQTGVSGNFQVANYNATNVENAIDITSNQSSYEPSTNGAAPLLGQTTYMSVSLGWMNAHMTGQKFNISGNNPISSITISPILVIPKSTTNQTYSLTIYGLSLTTIPLTIGNANSNTAEAYTGTTIPLTTLNPDYQYTAIENNGYTVATSQPLLNTTISQTAISNGSYIEEVQTQGQFKLPSAPDLTYGSANITEQLNVSSSQVLVLDINGLSYLSSISGKNGTINLIGSVNPTSSTSFLEIVEYTSSQWNSISGPPGFFSVAGVEYYFDEIVLGLTALLGIGGAAAHRRAAQLRRVK